MINQELRELRKKMALSQEDFARIIGVKLQSISRWELGKGNPGLKATRELQKIAKIQKQKE